MILNQIWRIGVVVAIATFPFLSTPAWAKSDTYEPNYSHHDDSPRESQDGSGQDLIMWVHHDDSLQQYQDSQGEDLRMWVHHDDSLQQYQDDQDAEEALA